MLGVIMFISKVMMEWLPNIHPLGLLIMSYTLVFRKKALIPLYIYVLLEGVYQGFSLWWVPYLYIWTVLWAVTMLLPRKLTSKKAMLVYPAICALHGLAFGTLYAPVFGLTMGMDLKAIAAWIAAGFAWDALQAAGNLAAGMLIVPLSGLLRKLAKQTGIHTAC